MTNIIMRIASVICFGIILILHIFTGYQPTNFEVLVTVVLFIISGDKEL